MEVGVPISLLFSTMLAAATLFAPVQAPRTQDPVFSSDVRLVRVLTTVRNPQGQLVGALNKEDFSIFDNGVRQEVAHFERQTAQPLSVTLLVDTSLSTAKDLRYETDSVSRFLKAVYAEGNPLDAVSLYSFNYDVTLLASFTRRRERLDGAMKSLQPRSGTSLYDAIYLACQNLEMREGRRVLIVVTDGGDTTSSKKYRDALDAVQRADAVLYAILVMPITNDAGRSVGGENALKSLASDTAGRVFTPSVMGPAVDAAFTDILKELRTQYFLGYYPRGVPSVAGSYHRLEVKVRSPDLQVNARSGYYEEVERKPASPAEGRGAVRGKDYLRPK
jgi:Ca-activated chloride channel family protein